MAFQPKDDQPRAEKQKDNSSAMSELRRDLVTGNWVVVAKGRGDRPQVKKFGEQEHDPIETCPFEDPQKSGNAEPTLMYPSTSSGPIGGNDWSVQVIPNKYPAFAGGVCDVIRKVGPYSVQDGRGFHEVIITRDHYKHLALLDTTQVEEILRAYKERYSALKDADCVKYISIFHNHRKEAGASLTHPHSQLIAIPIIPSDAKRSLSGASMFYRKHNKCVHCAMLDWEKEERVRIVARNEDFIAICPFISRDAYEVRIFPQNHAAHFEVMADKKTPSLAEIFHKVLKSLNDKLNNTPYNFYLHTAPIDGEDYPQYHWHFEIHPKTETNAGFEMGTGIEVSTVEPERAAEILRL